MTPLGMFYNQIKIFSAKKRGHPLIFVFLILYLNIWLTAEHISLLGKWPVYK